MRLYAVCGASGGALLSLLARVLDMSEETIAMIDTVCLYALLLACVGLGVCGVMTRAKSVEATDPERSKLGENIRMRWTALTDAGFLKVEPRPRLPPQSIFSVPHHVWTDAALTERHQAVQRRRKRQARELLAE